MSFFQSGKVDVSRVSREKLPAGPNGSQAVYRVRLCDVCDHLQANGGDRTQFDMTVISGPLAEKSAAELVMHSGYDKAWKAEKARGTIAVVLGAFLGMTRDQSGFKVNNDVFQKNARSVTYNGNVVANKTRDKTELPLVMANAEAFLVVTAYTDKKTGQRKVNPKTGQKSVTYEFLPLSANLAISTEFEVMGASQDSEDDAPSAPSDNDEPAVDALALALAAGWKVNKNAPEFYYLKGEPKQHKEAALRALFGG